MPRHILGRCFAMLLLAATAGATTLQQLTLEELTAAAGAVVRARAISSESRWENGHIWTFTTFEVTEALKGGPAARLQVRLIGGRVGSLTSTVEGVPRFRAGEEAYLFLATTGSGEWTVAGWTLGAFRLARNAAGAETVTQDAAGVTLFDPATRAFRAGGVRRMPVEEFRRRVNAALSSRSGGQR